MGDLIDRRELLKAIAKLTPKDTKGKIDWKSLAVWGWTKADIYGLVLKFPASKKGGDER